MDQSVVVLETKRLLLRELTLEDLDALDAMYQDPEVMRYLFGIQPRVQTEQDIIWNRERYKTDIEHPL